MAKKKTESATPKGAGDLTKLGKALCDLAAAVREKNWTACAGAFFTVLDEVRAGLVGAPLMTVLSCAGTVRGPCDIEDCGPDCDCDELADHIEEHAAACCGKGPKGAADGVAAGFDILSLLPVIFQIAALLKKFFPAKSDDAP